MTNIHLRKGGCLLAGMAAIVAAMPAYAQTTVATEEPVAEEAGVGEIVVTAQKRQESVNAVPLSVTAVTGEGLVKRGITDVSDLAKAVAGFSFQKSNYGSPVYQLRGIGFFDMSLSGAPTVSVYVDEVPLPYATMSRGASFDLERVEVLKGPQGTLFGQNSTGGAINYIAAKPTHDFQASFDAEYGSYDHVILGGMISGPITDTLRMRLAVQHEAGGGWQKSLTRPGDTLGDTEMTIGRLLVDWTPTERLSVGINLNGWFDRSDNQAAQLIGFVGNPANFPLFAQSPLAPAKARAADWDANRDLSRHDNFGQASARLGYDFDNGMTITAISAYSILDRSRSFVDSDGSAAQNQLANVPGKLQSFTQELRLQGEAAGNTVRWMVGGNFEDDRSNDNLITSVNDSRFAPLFSGVHVKSRQRVKTYAAFANVEWNFLPDLTLNTGIRYTDQNRRLEGCTYDVDGRLAARQSALASTLTGTSVTIAPGGCATLDNAGFPGVVTDKLNQDNVSWRAALDWTVAPAKLLYVTVSRGYKAGGFPTSTALRSASLRPAVQESLLAYEAGFKLGLFDRSVQLNGAVYYYNYRDKQVVGRYVDPTIGPIFALVNIPKSRVYGAELQFDWQPVDSLRLSAAGAYTNSKIRGSFQNVDVIGTPGDFGGESFSITPKWQGNADAECTRQIGAAETFLGVSAQYQSRTHSGLGDLPLFRHKAYGNIDLRAGVRLDDPRLTLTGFVRNVTNTYSWNSVINMTDGIDRFANSPRTFGLRLDYKY